MGWGEAHRTGAGTTGQIEDAHKALDCVSIAPGPLAVRVLEAVGRIAARTEIDHWNYRVLTRSVPIADTGDHDESFEIIEVYYDADDNVLAWATVTPGGESPNELQKELLYDGDPVGPANDASILVAARESDRVIAAWGARGSFLNRAAKVTDLLCGPGRQRLDCLGRTKGGAPKHPLYIRGEQQPELYRGPESATTTSGGVDRLYELGEAITVCEFWPFADQGDGAA